ncbi:hypothetical protein ACQ4PT_010804 [Festuca glaucescens]
MEFSPNKAAVSPAALSRNPAPSPAALPRKNVPAHAAWGRVQSATGEVPHVMGVAEYWPALSGGERMPPADVTPKSKASTTTVAAPSSSQATEHRGGFDGQHRGRGHQGRGHAPGHRLDGHHMSNVAPHPFTVAQPPPPLLPFFAPPPFCGAYYGPAIGYAEFAPAGWHVPPAPPPDAVHFVPYPSLPVHAMLPHMEQQAAQPHAEEPEQLQTSVEDLKKKIRSQIEFYFSENNLCCNLHLKQKMDEQGWVPLTKIANFNKVKGLTTDLGLILRSLASSTEVEVQFTEVSTDIF